MRRVLYIKEKLSNLLQQFEIHQLMEENISAEEVGAFSKKPYIFFQLTQDDAVLAKWLEHLACPVIGFCEKELAATQLAIACDTVVRSQEEAFLLLQNIEKSPLAALVLLQQLRLSETLSAQQALISESLAYATVQKGAEFSAWRAHYTPEKEKKPNQPPLKFFHDTKDTSKLNIVFDSPATDNAMNVTMRDAFCEALEMASLDISVSHIHLSAHGRCFSVGGDIAEFGMVRDPATAHWIRGVRLAARCLVKLNKPLSVLVEGAAIGAGAEIAAFATHLMATKDAWFQLPELKYGLIPGAGGTVSLVRRIGRHKTAFMGLSMKKIKAQQAYEWGLVDELVE